MSLQNANWTIRLTKFSDMVCICVRSHFMYNFVNFKVYDVIRFVKLKLIKHFFYCELLWVSMMLSHFYSGFYVTSFINGIFDTSKLVDMHTILADCLLYFGKSHAYVLFVKCIIRACYKIILHSISLICSKQS